jgi:hypothetical protein
MRLPSLQLTRLLTQQSILVGCSVLRKAQINKRASPKRPALHESLGSPGGVEPGKELGTGGAGSTPVGVSGFCLSAGAGLPAGGAPTRRRLDGQFLDPGGFEGCCSSHLLDGYFVGRCSVLWLRLLRPGLLTEEDKNAHSQDEHQDRGLRSSGLVNRACRWCSYVVARKTKASSFQSLRWCPVPHRGDKPLRTHSLRV